MGKIRKAWKRASLRRALEHTGFAPEDALRITDWMESPSWDNAPYLLDLANAEVVWDKPTDERPYPGQYL